MNISKLELKRYDFLIELGKYDRQKKEVDFEDVKFLIKLDSLTLFQFFIYGQEI